MIELIVVVGCISILAATLPNIVGFLYGGYFVNAEDLVNDPYKSWIDDEATSAGIEPRFACEISISTTIDHEVGNVSKCLKAGFLKIAVICLEDDRLKKIEKAISGSLGSESKASVEYFQPDEFINYLKALPVQSAQDKTKVSRGYKVKYSLSNVSEEEKQLREEAAMASIADAMKRKK